MRSAIFSLSAVIISSLLSSAGFLIGDGRVEWYLLAPLYRFFGDTVLTAQGFLFGGVVFYICLWIYLSVSVFILLKLFGNNTDLEQIFYSLSFFVLPHSLIFPFSIFHDYFIQISAIVLFGFLIPFSITPHVMKRSTNADFYRRALSLMVSLYLLLIFWTTFYEPLGAI